MQKWLAPLQLLESELEPTEALSHYIMTKIEISRTQPKASKLFALEVIQGAPHILPILKGPLKKLFKRKAKVILNCRRVHIKPDSFDVIISMTKGIMQT